MRAFDETDKMCKELITHGEDEFRRKIEAQIRDRLRFTGFYESFSEPKTLRMVGEQETLEWLLRDVLNVSVI